MKTAFSLSGSFLVLLGTWACVAPLQDFPVGSADWLRANPPYEALERAREQNAAHRVLVGVLDGGTDYNAPLLSRHIHVLETPAESGRPYGVGYDVLGKDYFPYFSVIDPDTREDVSGILSVRDHGTHVAQLVSLNDESIGLIPVRVLPVPLIESEASADLAVAAVRQIAEGIDFAVSHGAAVVNMSLGLQLDDLSPEQRDLAMREIEGTLVPGLLGRWSGALMVCAAGNESTVMTEPGQAVPATLSAPDLLSVGALKNRDTIAAYSNQGRFVDVYVRGSDVASSLPDEGWGRSSGTSMAAPLVAHLAAQLKAIDPLLTPRELRALILNTADVRELAVEGSSSKATVRVVSMSRARQAARSLLGGGNPSARKLLLTPPFAHGQAH